MAHERNDGPMDWRQARPGEHILPHYPAQEWPADTAAYKRGYWRGFRHSGILFGVLWTLGSAVLLFGFHCLGVR
jgi:hypothetical protein